MVKIGTLDPSTPFDAQLRRTSGPIVLTIMFFVPKDAMEEFLALWRADAEFMQSSPGFVSTRLRAGTGDSQLLRSTAVWQSTEALAAALAAAQTNPAIQEKAAMLPDGIIAYPHVFEKAVVGEAYADDLVDKVS